MPTFCRHNRFVQNCPICREPEPQRRAPRRKASGTATASRARTASGSGATRRSEGMRIRQAARQADDGYRSGLVPGLKLTDDARRLAAELSFAAGRLAELAADPPGAYAEVRDERDPEEACWLAFLISYLSPAEGEDPWVAVRTARTPWATAEAPAVDGLPLGPRTAHDPARGNATVAAYRAWARRAGSQAAAFAGEPHWTPARRFDRAFERLSLPGFHRSARFDLLVSLGRLGRFDLAPGSLKLGGDDETTVAGKRVFGIGDALLLDRRAAELAEACEVPLEALDLALFNWARPAEGRATLGARPGVDAGAQRIEALLLG